MSGRLKHRRLGGQHSQLLVGAGCRLSNRVEPMESFQVKMPCGSIRGTQTASPLASPQVVRTGKHSREVRIVEPKTPYEFPLILGLATLTTVCVLQGQGGHSSHRGQASCCLPSECPHEKGRLQGEGSCVLSAQLGPQQPYYCSYHWNSTTDWS